MAKGTEAKAQVTDKIIKAFGDDFIVEQDKKLYVWATEAGQKIQVAISLTCPKTEVVPNTSGGDWNFEDDAVSPQPVVEPSFTPAAITEEENKTLEELMKKFGL